MGSLLKYKCPQPKEVKAEYRNKVMKKLQGGDKKSISKVDVRSLTSCSGPPKETQI